MSEGLGQFFLFYVKGLKISGLFSRFVPIITHLKLAIFVYKELNRFFLWWIGR